MAGFLNKQMMKQIQRIQSPEEVSKLMEDLWVGHKAGLKPHENLVFWVDLPPLTDEEKAEIEAKKKAKLKAEKENYDTQNDLYGAFI